MFRSVRLRLTLLYAAAGMMLISLLGGGTYALLGYFFQSTTDLALEHVMAQQFIALGVSLPDKLSQADQVWASSRSGLPFNGLLPALPLRSAPQSDAEEQDAGEAADHEQLENEEEHGLDAELAAVFVLALSDQGELLPGFNVSQAPMAPDHQAVARALATGSDLRTVVSPTGSRVRLLTYRVPGVIEPAIVQVGRSLSDQDGIRGQLVLGLVVLGGISLALLALGSWFLAGQSLQPTQIAFERQQAFVANASHELRTPLTLIRATADVARRELKTDDPHRKLLDQILTESDHMSRLIEDQLLLSRIDSGALAITQKQVRLSELFESLRETIARLADDHGLELEVGATDMSVWADPTRLRQVMLVVLDNAIRHTPSGGVIRIKAEEQGRQIVLSVSDTGPGIGAEDLPHIFERYYRGDPAHSASGTGLGLSIAKGLIEAQGGHIEVESQPGHGTTVRLRLRGAQSWREDTLSK